MKIKNKILSILLCCLLTLSLSFLFITTVKANDIGNSLLDESYYDFKYDLTIDNYTYFLFFNTEYDYNLLEPFTFSIELTYDNTYYDIIQFRYSDGYGGFFLNLFSTALNRTKTLAIFGQEEQLIYINGLQLYSGTPYTISLNNDINYVFNIKNQVSGFYTFNEKIYPLEILTTSSYTFSNFSLSGQFAYNSDLPSFIDSIDIDLDNDYQTLSFVATDSLGNSTAIAVFGSFNEDNMDMRYLYLSTQYIDTMLYQYLKLNGLFSFVPPLETYSYNYWDLISSYVNIPVDIMSSIWNFSIFNTGVTILTFFATILSIALAIRIGRYYL